MRRSLTASLRRPIALPLAMLGVLAVLLALKAPAVAAFNRSGPIGKRSALIVKRRGGIARRASGVPRASAGALSAGGAVLRPFIVGGQEASISQFPWQVFVMNLLEGGKEITCGGSILDPTHILTAAHCVDHEGGTTTYPPGGFFVLAGASNVSGFEETLTLPAGAQERRVSRIRAHPYYSPLPNIKDDVAVLELTSPLELSPAASAQAIGLIAAGATPAPGTALSVSGYGKQEGAEKAQPNGKLYSTSLTAMSSDGCREEVGVNSAVLLCASGPTSSTCQGDSGGPLTQGSPPSEVGIVDFGGAGCPVGHLNGFSNVAAPEVRAFIEGSEAPPVAARPSSAPVIRSIGAAPVDFSPLTCEPGTWSGAPSFTYTFQAENGSATALQSGPSNTYTPPPSEVGVPLACVVQASNPGGVTTYRSATTAPIGPDAAPPVSSISGFTCHLRSCTLSISATDPNFAALGVEPWVSYEVTKPCHAASKGHKRAKVPLCHSTVALILPVSNVAPGIYRVSAAGLPYREEITFRALATDAAGLKARPLTRTTKLRPPRAKKKGTKKKGKRRGAKPRHGKH